MRQPVRLDEAEAYELPELPGRSANASNRKLDEIDEAFPHEEVGLLSEEPKLNRHGRDDEDRMLNDDLASGGNEGDAMLGKGKSIEELIARAVPSTDDPTLPTLTARVLLLGSFFCVLGAAASQVFYFKSNAPQFSSYFIILATYPLGHLLADERIVERGTRILGVELNPGEFSVKEAILVSVIATSGASSAYAADILVIMDLYYHMPLSPISSIVLLLTTQCIGFGLAGSLQALLVSVPSMYWPSTLVTVQLFNTLYSKSSSTLSRTQRIVTAKRLQVFLFVFLATFVYQFFPFLLFPSLTSIATLCFIDQSWWMRTLGSGYTGLGIFDLSFDWSSIGKSGPLYTPFWALVNYFGGLGGFCWVVMPIILILNVWDARNFPDIATSTLYNSAFQKFDVSSILRPDLSLDEEAWNRDQPLLLSPLFAISYAMSFAALTSILVHVWLWHKDEIREALANRSELNDVHNTLMRAYREVPQSWYIAMLALNFGASILLVKTTQLQMPIWALVLAMATAIVFLVPVGIIAAVSNTVIGLNVLTEFVAGVLMPGKPIGNVTFKCLGYMAMSQALALTEDLKLGWYTSIPPREMFCCQILGTVLGALTNYITLTSVITEKRAFLDGTSVDPTGQWVGRNPAIFYSASIIWGAVAPARFFAGKYRLLYLGFPLGVVVPVILWFAHKRWPKLKLHKVVFPIICSGAAEVPQYPTNVIFTGILCSVFANKWFSNRHPETHGRYIYVISSALDAGTSITALAIYILFGGVIWSWKGPEWWGNSSIDTEHCMPGS